MSFYRRKIPYYKSFRLIDTDGDGIKDTITYAPYSNFYYLQFGIDQSIRNIGHYNLGFERPVEVIDFSGIWDESNDGSNDGHVGSIGGTLTPPQGDIISATDLTFDAVQFCNDPEASNYDPSLIGVPGFTPCNNNTCCTYTEPGQYGTNFNGTTTNATPIDCLAFYTDWGPWNDNLFLNDVNQIYSIKNGCSLTFRLMNLQSVESSDISGIVPGGWYGASIKIEINEGNGFQTLLATSPYIQTIGNDIQFGSNGNVTLGQKVRLWRAQSGTNPIKYYTTKPYRDLVIVPPINSQIRITYNNSADPLYTANYTKLRLQVIKGTPTSPVPSNPTPTTVTTNGNWSWSQNTSTILPFLGTPEQRQTEGETFHYINTTNVSTNYTKLNIWERYLSGYDTPSTTVPWGPSGSDVQAGTFYPTQNLTVLYDYNRYINSSIIQNTTNPSVNYNSNPFEVLQDFTFVCTTTQNYISFFDKNGDGFIEYDQNYPNGGNGSVDDGLFSKTRYDSPYIYLKPGTKDNVLPLSNNPLTQTSQSQSVAPISPPSTAGWRNYAYPGNMFATTPSQVGFNYDFSNTSPTCQLGGVDLIQNTETVLTDTSNSNIFLPQSDVFTNSNNLNATFGTGKTVPHTWNIGLTNANGGCCAKKYDSILDISMEGPYLNSLCSRCHAQMTTRSAQPVFENSIKIAMQTTDSDIYYGPFYDPQNPTYNGYGLAFSKANKFCRDVRNKNGVKVDGYSTGTTSTGLYVGGILHGAAVQNTPTSNITDNYGVQYSPFEFYTINLANSSQSCPVNTKLPLKCTKVSSSDPNCPSGNCMKCLFCFKCNSEEKQPGVYTGQ